MTKKIAWVVDEQKDNVATILGAEIEPGTSITVPIGEKKETISVKDKIVYGHKIAIKPIKKDDTIYKYGLSIGKATQDIEVGEHVHVHNIESNRGRGDLAKKEAN